MFVKKGSGGGGGEYCVLFGWNIVLVNNCKVFMGYLVNFEDICLLIVFFSVFIVVLDILYI